MAQILKIFGILGALGVAAIVVGLVIADRQVGRNLGMRSHNQVPAILSDFLRVDRLSTITPARLRNELVARSYVEVSSAPSREGQYRFTQGGFEIVPKAFRLPTGYAQKAELVRISGDDSDHRGFFLEPRVVSYLGSSQIEARSYRRMNDIPKHLSAAVIAIEDERFYSHYGLDLIGIARALVINIRAGSLVQGGSTLTQQLAKNLFLTPARTLRRKLTEACAAISLERRLSKDEILELYLNEIYLGQEGNVALHGVSEAARSFFGKDVKRLSLAESALLAGIIRAPSAYNPRRHPQRAKARRNTVLLKLAELGIVSSETAQQAIAQPLVIQSEAFHRRTAPHFVDSLSKDIAREVNVEAAALAGLSIYTGLDLELQRCAETTLSRAIEGVERQYPSVRRRTKPLEAGLVAIEPFSGKIRAWAGGRDFAKNQFDHVAQAQRQIGSTFKPFLYLTALDGSLNEYRPADPTSILPDQPISIELPNGDVWEPKNYDEKFRGDVTLRFALEHSLNMPALYVAQRVGIDAVANTARLFNIADSIQAVPSLSLGAVETSLLRLTASYAALANGGVYVEPRPYLWAIDKEGTIISDRPLRERRVADEPAVFVLTNILQGVVERGTARAVRNLGYTGVAAGKTGTSDDARDAWFVGYTPTLAVGVWVGFDDNAKLGLTGAQAAVPLWSGFMNCAAPISGNYTFLPPRGVEFLNIDSSTGQIATDQCPRESVAREVFVSGTEPKAHCTRHGDYYGDEHAEPSPPASQPRRQRRQLWEMIFGN